MATYIYVLKSPLRHVEDDRGGITKLDRLTADDYVAALRDGPGYGTAPEDLRGNLVPLKRFMAGWKDSQLWPLRLYSESGTLYALAIFGTVRNGKIPELESDPTWQRIGRITCGSDRVTCKVALSKFGTGHKKLFLMVASERFDWPAGMKWSFQPSSGEFTARTINQYIRDW
ncbi:MAG TPA: hypothetical protein VFZ21_11365 [Gemmatimonadaceae bacterium]|jgi:hypothetical protein|nr:hypothetical protein [Gemmatimonadaceae bacterium]